MTTSYAGIERRSVLNSKNRGRTSDEIQKLRMLCQTITHCTYFPERTIGLLKTAALTLEKDLFRQGIPHQRLQEIIKDACTK